LNTYKLKCTNYTLINELFEKEIKNKELELIKINNIIDKMCKYRKAGSSWNSIEKKQEESNAIVQELIKLGKLASLGNLNLRYRDS
jgi:hypothetical protein